MTEAAVGPLRKSLAFPIVLLLAALGGPRPSPTSNRRSRRRSLRTTAATISPSTISGARTSSRCRIAGGSGTPATGGTPTTRTSSRAKGYPIIGQRTFFIFTGISDTLFEAVDIPTPQGASRATSGSSGEFFGNGQQLLLSETVIASFDLFHGSTAFRPKDWEIRVTPASQFQLPPGLGEPGRQHRRSARSEVAPTTRSGLQEAFAEVRLFTLDRRFDFMSVRAGIQGFTSDFRGFIFSDNQPGVKLFGNFDNNKYQWNAAYFYMLEKDTNSHLNTFQARTPARRRREHLSAELHFARATPPSWKLPLQPGPGRLPMDRKRRALQHQRRARPPGRSIRAVRPRDLRVFYLGWSGDGHIGRV